MFEKIRKTSKYKEDLDYHFSDHSLERMAWRDLSEADVNEILCFGKKKHHGGKVTVTYQGKKVVLSGDETTIITTYKKAKR